MLWSQDIDFRTEMVQQEVAFILLGVVHLSVLAYPGRLDGSVYLGVL
jgi:hypothetical protein